MVQATNIKKRKLVDLKKIEKKEVKEEKKKKKKKNRSVRFTHNPISVGMVPTRLLLP